jgi:tubulin-folding cofactor B
MSDNTKMLGFYSVVSGMEIHIIDTDPFSLSRGGGLTDASLVQKYRMDDEVYEKRKGTMREFIKKKREADPNFKLNLKGPTDSTVISKEIPGPETVEGITIGNRCELTPGARRGTVKFIGEIGKSGWWVGIQLDEPSGLHDGSAKGVKYFECPMNYGTFARGKNIRVGDYPERDLLDDDDDDDDDEKENTNNDDDEDEI